MTYRNHQPAARNVSPPDLADGRTTEQWTADVDEKWGIIEADYHIWNPATQEWESARQGGDSWQLWTEGAGI